MKRWLLALCCLAAALFLGHGLWADGKRLALRAWVFRLPGTELGLDIADMSGDGLQDLVMAHMSGATGAERSVSVFLQTAGAERFPPRADRSWAAPADACAFVAGDFSPAPGGEVIFLCPSRLVLAEGKGKVVELKKVPGFFDYPEQGGLPVWDLSRDLDGDGLPELLFPSKDGYRIFARTASTSLTERSLLQIPVDQRFGPAFETAILNRFLSASARLRRLVITDLNTDGRQDLVAYREGGLARFLQRADGGFELRPDLEAPLALVQSGKKKGSEEDEESEEGDHSELFENIRLSLQDVDGDGRADLLATRTVGEIGVFETLRTQQLIFRGKRGAKGARWNEDKPDTLINLKGVSGDPVLVDWDGDGKKDLVVSSYRMDMFTNAKRAFLESLTVTYMIFRQHAKGPLFSTEPDYVKDVDLPLESLQQRGGQHAVLFEADLNGDGVRDMVAREEDGGLRVLLGELSESFFGKGKTLGFAEDRPIRLRGVGPTEAPRIVDLDGDGSHELILEPYAGDDLAARTVRIVGVAR